MTPKYPHIVCLVSLLSLLSNPSLSTPGSDNESMDTHAGSVEGDSDGEDINLRVHEDVDEVVLWDELEGFKRLCHNKPIPSDHAVREEYARRRDPMRMVHQDSTTNLDHVRTDLALDSPASLNVTDYLFKRISHFEKLLLTVSEDSVSHSNLMPFHNDPKEQDAIETRLNYLKRLRDEYQEKRGIGTPQLYAIGGGEEDRADFVVAAKIHASTNSPAARRHYADAVRLDKNIPSPSSEAALGYLEKLYAKLKADNAVRFPLFDLDDE